MAKFTLPKLTPAHRAFNQRAAAAQDRTTKYVVPVFATNDEETYTLGSAVLLKIGDEHAAQRGRSMKLRHDFVEYIPDELQEGTLYISVTYATAAHRCCCGCGNEVITPLSPTDWTLLYDGKSVSLDPSIGNWSFPCQSHYWITHNQVKWARRWTPKEIAAGRAHDREAKAGQYAKRRRIRDWFSRRKN